VTIDNADQAVTLSSEEIIYEQTQRADTDATAAVTNVANISTTTASSSYQLQIINASDIAGAAANLKVSLETDGYLVASIGSDLAQSRDRTVVVYAPGLEDEALALSQQLGNALLSADAEAEATIVIYVGNDFTDLQ